MMHIFLILIHVVMMHICYSSLIAIPLAANLGKEVLLCNCIIHPMSTRTVLTGPSPAASLNGPPRGQSPSLVPGGLGELPGCVRVTMEHVLYDGFNPILRAYLTMIVQCV